MQRDYRHAVFLTKDDYAFLRQMVDTSTRGGKGRADARQRISRELATAEGERIECDENGNVPHTW